MKHHTNGGSWVVLKLQTLFMELMMVVIVGGIAAFVALALTV